MSKVTDVTVVARGGPRYVPYRSAPEGESLIAYPTPSARASGLISCCAPGVVGTVDDASTPTAHTAPFESIASPFTLSLYTPDATPRAPPPKVSENSRVAPRA